MAGLLFLYYLILVLGLLYTNDSAKALKDIGQKVPFLVFPIMLGSLPILNQLKLSKLLRFFVWATVVSVLICLFNAALNYLAFSHYQVFYFRNFSFYRFIPPHYLGMYINFAYALVFLGFTGAGRLITKKHWAVFALIVLGLGLVFIAVRMQFLVFLVINVWCGIALIRKYRKKKRSWVILIGLFIVFFGLAFSFKGSRNRIVDTYNELKSINKLVANKQTNARFYLWPAAIEVIKDHFWLGTGGGSENTALNRKLENEKAIFWDGTTTYYLYQKNYNCHNSFLQHFTAHGLLGFICFTALFVVPFFNQRLGHFKNLAVAFLLITALSFSTESMLQRQAGVLFFSFFYSLFFVHRLNLESTNKGL